MTQQRRPSDEQNKPGTGEDKGERTLDEALEETFPASDPISIDPEAVENERPPGN
ncbi:hypothetical protein [Cupriavidus sp. AU9028]|uniref:hypothetical protein n=1 Tax=Cupriavidus sp. AU9028 TaxID=2871157 RepID=UPI001C98A500|nr:hypothetical protein [Cupriavidus sp. AU9028]MBY4895973.1 hypothetical protein [Cupriavidus sp. AU9028]